MEREQTPSPGNPDRARLAGAHTHQKAPRAGEGAASALASLKRLERDRMNLTPADDRPQS